MRATLLQSVVVLAFTLAALADPPPDPKYDLIPQTPPATAVNSVAVSPDATRVATASGEGGVRLYDARTGDLLRVFGAAAGDRAVAFTPDGRSLTAAGFHMDKLAALWDVASGRRLRTFAGHTEWEADATAVSPDGKLLASTGTDRQILVWEIATGELRLRLKDQPARVAALAFSPDSATLAAGGGDRAVRLWDCATGNLRHTFTGHADWVCTLAFAPDGKQLVSASCDWGFHRGHDWPRPPQRGPEQSEWRLWDVPARALRRTVRSTGRLLSLAFAPDGASLACGVGQQVRLYALAGDTNPDAAPPRVLTTHDADVTAVSFTPDVAAVISGSHDQAVRRTRLADTALEWQAPGWFEQVNAVALSDDGSRLITGSGDWRFAQRGAPPAGTKLGPGAVRLWDPRTGRLLRRLGDPANQVMAVAISPDGRRIAAGGGIGAAGAAALHVWDTDSGAPVWSARDTGTEMLAVAFARDGASLATGAADGVVRVRDARTGAVTATLTRPADTNPDAATAVAFAPDGNLLYVGLGRGGVRVWDLPGQRLARTCDAPPSQSQLFTVDRPLNSVTLTRDGTTLASCASSVNNEFVGPLLLWDARTGTRLRDFTPENIHGRPTVLSPDGSILATGGKSVQLWDTRTGKPIRKLYGRLKRTQAITFSADGRLVVAGGSYGTTNLWDVATGRHLVTLFAFPDPRDGATIDHWLACTPDGYYDASPGARPFLAWRVEDELRTPPALAELHDPARVAASLAPAPAAKSAGP